MNKIYEEVIKGLECCMIPSKDGCDACPYIGKVMCRELLGEDVIALLKAQEPVEPIIDTYWETPSVYDNDVKITENRCGACGTEIEKWDKYCRECGRKVKWE